MKRSSSSGFTLIELLIVMTIIVILASIALPSYRNYIVRSHRDAAKACLTDYAQFMERYYTTQLTYVGAEPSLGCGDEDNLSEHYTFTLTAATQRTYTVTAAPAGTQAHDDAKCGSLSLDGSGTRSASGSGGTAYCW